MGYDSFSIKQMFHEQPQFFISLGLNMKKLKQAIIGLGLVFCASLNIAQAETFNLGTLESDKVYTVTNIVGAKPGAWQDFINFSVDEDTYLQTAVYSLSFLTMGAVDNFWLQLTDLADNSIVFDTQILLRLKTTHFRWIRGTTASTSLVAVMMAFYLVYILLQFLQYQKRLCML